MVFDQNANRKKSASTAEGNSSGSRRSFLKRTAVGTALTAGLSGVVSGNSDSDNVATQSIPDLDVEMPAEPADDRAVLAKYTNPYERIETANGTEVTTDTPGPDVVRTYADDDPFALEIHLGGAGASLLSGVVSGWCDFEIDTDEPEQIELTVDYDYEYESKLAESPIPFSKQENEPQKSAPTNSSDSGNSDEDTEASTEAVSSIAVPVAGLGADLITYSTATMFASATIMSTDSSGEFTKSSPEESTILFQDTNTVSINPISTVSDSDSVTDEELFGSVTGFEADPDKVYRLVFTTMARVDAVGLSTGSTSIGNGRSYNPPGLWVKGVQLSFD